MSPTKDESVHAEAPAIASDHAEVGILGVGAIAEAIVTGLCETPDGPAPSVVLAPRSANRAAALATRHPTVTVAASPQDMVDRSSVVLMCLRPQDTGPVLTGLRFRPGQAVVSAAANLSLSALQRLVAPGVAVARTIPLPAVAVRVGMTAVYPADPWTVRLFGRLGQVLTLTEESQLDDLSTASATVAAYFSYLQTITEWLTGRGLPAADAYRYVSAVFGQLTAETPADTAPADGFGSAARAHSTPGGLNEWFQAALRDRGVFTTIEGALDDLRSRLEPPAPASSPVIRAPAASPSAG